MPEVQVEPGDANSTHDISINGGGEIFGIKLLDGFESLQMIPDKSDNTLATDQGKKFGDWEPKHSHIEQRDWSGGRGVKDHSDDKSRFFDSMNANTWVPGKILPSYQWYIAEGGHRDADQNMPGNMNWVALTGDALYINQKFVASASYDAEAALIWIEREGNPGDLTLELCADSGNEPDTVLQTVTVSIATITDVISVWHLFDWSSTESLTSTTIYHIKLYGDSADNKNNHWKIGVNMSTNTALKSSDGSTWATLPGFSIYFRVEDDAAAVKYHMFFLDQTDQYFISQPATGDSVILKWDETDDEIDAIAEGGDALSGIVKSVAVSKNIAHCARGTGAGDETIWTYDPSTTAGQDDATGTNKADHVLAANHKEDGPQIWRGENDEKYLTRSNVKDFNTDLVFGEDIKLPQDYDIIALAEYNGAVWARTKNSLHFVISDKVEELPVGLNTVIESDDFMPLVPKDLFLYVAWSHSVEKYLAGQSANLDDMGPWKDEGLPMGRRGYISAIEPAIGGIFFGINAGSAGTSSVLWHNGMGYHEAWRAPRAGIEVTNVRWQAVAGEKPRLWISCGADLYYMEFAQDVINPLQDNTVNYQHEFVIESATIDMDAAAIPKAFRTITAWTENLVSGIHVGVDYQIDENVGTANWSDAGNIYEAGEDIVDINEGNRRKLRYRLRGKTNDSDIPPIVEATVLKAFGRVPWAPQFSLVLKTGSYQVTWQGAPDHNPNDFLDFLMNASLNAILFHFKCVWPYADDMFVTVEPSSVFPDFVDRNNGNWQGSLRVVLSAA